MTSTNPGAASTGAGEDDGLLELRRSIAKAVKARVKDEVPGISAHFGEDYERADDPEAAVYRSTGATFHWVAFAFSPWRMWDLHVGVVPVEGRRLSVGFHASERASTVLLEDMNRLGESHGAPVRHQASAFEYQANLPLIDVDAVSLEKVVDAVVRLCRAYAPVAAAVPCPPGMRDGAA